MIAGGKVKRVFLARHKVDFRKGHSGLLAEAYQLGLQPMVGDVVIFMGRDRKRLKILYADGNGLWVSYKLFVSTGHKQKMAFLDHPEKKQISVSELALLIDGARYTLHARPEDYRE